MNIEAFTSFANSSTSAVAAGEKNNEKKIDSTLLYEGKINDTSNSITSGHSILADATQTAQYQVKTVSKNGKITRTYSTYNPRRAAFLNLLDHSEHFSRRKRKRRAASMLGSTMVTSVQGALVSGILGILLSFTGLTAGPLAALENLKTMAEPITGELQKFLEAARKNGLPEEELEKELRRNLRKHFLPRRLVKYAALTMLGGGAGSFWMGAASLGVVVVCLPEIITSSLAFANSAIMFRQALANSAEDILSYRAMHHPEVVEARIQETLQMYREVRQQNRTFHKTHRSEFAIFRNREFWQNTVRDYVDSSVEAQKFVEEQKQFAKTVGKNIATTHAPYVNDRVIDRMVEQASLAALNKKEAAASQDPLMNTIAAQASRFMHAPVSAEAPVAAPQPAKKFSLPTIDEATLDAMENFARSIFPQNTSMAR